MDTVDEAEEPLVDSARRDAARRPNGRIKRFGWAIAWVLWIVTAAWLATSTLISATAPVGPAEMRLSMKPARTPRLEVDVPPLGQVDAPTHKGPVAVRLSIERFNQATIERASTQSQRTRLSEDIGRDLKSLVIRYSVIGVVVSVVIGLGAAAAFPRRSSRSVVAGAVVAPVAFLALGAGVLPGFDAGRFRDSTFNGSLSSANALLTSVGSLSAVDERAAALSDRLADLYSASASAEIGTPDDVVLLHISDIHLNPIGLRIARQLAAEVQADAVIDTGDTTSFGLDFEGDFTEQVNDFGVPYLWVAGNHDTASVRQAIAATSGVTPIDGRVVTVGGIRIVGVNDPTVTALRRPNADTWRAEYAADDQHVADVVEDLRPDVLAVHNPVQANAALGKVDTVVAGHTHRFAFGGEDGTNIAVVASSGATGLGSLLVENDVPYAFEVLRYRQGKLVAVDQVEFDGLDGRFSLRRLLPEDAETSGIGDLLEESVKEPDASEVPEVLPTTTVDADESTTTSEASVTVQTPAVPGASTTATSGR